jgi:hypothetical protein
MRLDEWGMPMLSPEAQRQVDLLVAAHDLLPARSGRVSCSRCEVSFGLEDYMQASVVCRHLVLVDGLLR